MERSSTTHLVRPAQLDRYRWPLVLAVGLATTASVAAWRRRRA